MNLYNIMGAFILLIIFGFLFVIMAHNNDWNWKIVICSWGIVGIITALIILAAYLLEK